AHNPGAARPQLAVDDPGLQPRRRQAAAPRLRQGTPPLMTSDRDVEGFLALLAAQRAPRTVDAYRRDLASVSAWLGGPSARATTEDIARHLAELGAAGLSAAPIARRAAALRSFYRHQVLLGARADNPAAELELPRRRRMLPRTLSPLEAERLIEAATGTTPR